MEYVKMSDVNSDMEVAKTFNRLVDSINELETRNDEYNAVVNEHNKAVDELNEKGA